MAVPNGKKGLHELLEEMFSRIKELREDVKASDQRIGNETQEERKKKLCLDEGKNRRRTKPSCGIINGHQDEGRTIMCEREG